MIQNRSFGKNRPAISCLGCGAIVLEGYYGASDDSQTVETIRHALYTEMPPNLSTGNRSSPGLALTGL